MLIWSLACEGSKIQNLQRVSYLGTDHKKTYGVAWGARSKTKYSPKGKLNEKIFMLWPKKIHTRNLITKKIPAARKFPTPPPPPLHKFFNGPSLRTQKGVPGVPSGERGNWD